MPLSPSTITTLFLTEGVLKLISGTTFLLSPSSILKHFYPHHPHHDISISQSSPLSTALTRIFGSQTLAFSIPLFLAARKDTHTQKLVYYAMLAREGMLAVTLLTEIAGLTWRGRDEREEAERERALEEGKGREGEQEKHVERNSLKRGLWLWFGEVVPFFVGRVIVLGSGAWFG